MSLYLRSTCTAWLGEYRPRQCHYPAGPDAGRVAASHVDQHAEAERPQLSVDRGLQTVEPAPRFAAAVSEPVVPPALPSVSPALPATPAPASLASDDRTVPVASEPAPQPQTVAAEPTPEEPSATTPAESTLMAPLPEPEPDLLARLTPLPHVSDPGLPGGTQISAWPPPIPTPACKTLPIVGGSPADTHDDMPSADSPVSPWHAPAALLASLHDLSGHPVTSRWAQETIHLVNDLGTAVEENSDQRLVILSRLEEAAQQSPALAAVASDGSVARKVSCAGFALTRRVAVWKQLLQFDPRAAETAQTVDPKVLTLCLGELDHMTRDSAEGGQWRKFLLLDALQAWSAGHTSPQDRIPSDMARWSSASCTGRPCCPPSGSSSPTARWPSCTTSCCATWRNRWI